MSRITIPFLLCIFSLQSIASEKFAYLVYPATGKTKEESLLIDWYGTGYNGCMYFVIGIDKARLMPTPAHAKIVYGVQTLSILMASQLKKGILTHIPKDQY